MDHPFVDKVSMKKGSGHNDGISHTNAVLAELLVCVWFCCQFLYFPLCG